MSESQIVMGFQAAVAVAAGLVEVCGVLTILLGVARAFPGAVRAALRDADDRQQRQRRLGRALLLGLEFLVAADVIRSVAVAPTLEGVAVLALLVVVRTFLNWTLELEIEGRWPWQRDPATGRALPTAPESIAAEPAASG